MDEKEAVLKTLEMAKRVTGRVMIVTPTVAKIYKGLGIPEDMYDIADCIIIDK